MTDASAGSPAWVLPPGNYISQRERPYNGAPRRFSRYVEVRDGTRLAVDVYLPTPASDAAKFPALFTFTPYCRRFALAHDAPQLTEAAPTSAQYRDFFPAYGYALVTVDTRGTGASFGARTGMRAPEERLDYHDLVDWAARQPWCNGRVCITGISYVGAAADFAASTGHPAIRAIMPLCSVWDTWGDMFYPGGLLFTGMLGGYGRLIEALDQDRRDVLADFPYFAAPGLAGPAPVDDDTDGTLLAQAIAEHAANFDMTDFITQLGLRDATLRHDPDYSTATIAPKTYAAGIPSGLPHYGVSGWMDGAGYTAGAVSRFHALPNKEKRLLLGPWDHGARTHVSPARASAQSRFEMLAETLRFFDQHVAERETGLLAERPVHYFTMIEEAWHAADSFPPAGTSTRTWSLGPAGALQDGPAAEGADEYRVDHAIGTGKNTRYERIAGQPVEEYYPDWHGRDARMAHWTSAPLSAPIEITGTPAADLWITADTPDAAIIVYLEDVAPDGRTRYITEGALRASCRQVAPAPANHPHPGPYHPFTLEAQRHLVPNEPARLEIALHPTSWLLRAGHRVRLALAGADHDHLARVPFGVSPLLRILRGPAHPSVLKLPIAPRHPGTA
jgi:putative CocE/NonD family hydrolase